MPYCIYLRKSRADVEAEARGEGEALARHKRILTELASQRGYEVGEIYHEVVSGDSLAARVQAQRLLTDVQAGRWEGVLVMEIERLARGDTIDQGIVMNTFKYSGTKIITPSKVYDPNNEFDEEYVEFSLYMSRREYKTIARRMNAGRIASVKEGNYIGSLPPYGYAKVKDGKAFTLAPVPEEAAIVRNVFEWYTRGDVQPDGSVLRLGVARLARKLNDMQIPTRKGGVWVVATLRDMLRNPVYIGKLRWNWRKGVTSYIDGKKVNHRPHHPESEWLLVDGRHEPLVDEFTWKEAQNIMKSNRPAAIPEGHTMQNPLAGLMVCGKCGRKMTRRPYNKTGQHAALICSCNACDNVSAELRLVEARIIDSLRAWLDERDVEYANSQTVSCAAEIAALDAVDAELVEYAGQRESLYKFLERGIYTEFEYVKRRKSIDSEVEALRAKRKRLEKEIVQKDAYNTAITKEIPKVRAVVETYYTLESPQARNDILKEVLEKVVYVRDKGGRWSGVYDDFTLQLFHRIPKIPDESME